MRKTLLSCLTIAAMLFTGSLQGFALEQDGQGVYQIASIEDMVEFSEIVNFGEDAAANAVLTCDLTFEESDIYYPIGVVDHPYTGTFDGQGHKLIDINIDSDNLDYTDYIGVFGVLGGGAHIKNLFVTGENAFIMGNAFVAGIAGGTNGTGTVTIENCGNEATIYATAQNAAGILGVDMESKADVTILNCYNTGDIYGDRECAAICGWIGDRGVCKGCWNTYDFAGSNGCDTGRPFCRFNGCDFEGCWDIQGVQNADEAGTITEEMLAGMETGEFCFKVLNQTLTEDIAWYQAIGTDAHPFPIASHGTVYAVGDLNCDGTSKSGETTYSNSNSSNRDPHQFVDGFCSVCHEWDANYLTADAEGYFDLAKAADLVWYTTYMNNKNNEQKNARLTADIDMTGVEWTPISNSDATRFKATFDGQEHTIANFDVESDNQRIALFGNVTGGAVIKNVTVTGSFKAVAKVAGIIGFADGGGDIKLDNVINKANVYSTGSTDANAAGLVACAVNGTTITATACANFGAIGGQPGQTGAFSGWSQGGTTWNNCWNNGTISDMDGNRNLFRGSADAIDCVDTSDTDGKTQGNDVAIDGDMMTSGELCYRYLNATNTENICWYQTLGQDAHPVPFASHGTVYVAGAQTCDGTPKPGASEGYSNDASGNRDPHQFANGFCTVCDHVDYAYKTAGEDGFITLDNANDLKWFIVATKTQDTKTLKAKLTADVNYEGQKTFGAERCNFAGTLDGQDHTITIDLKRGMEGRAALFNNIENATIQNLTIAGNITNEGQFAAGVAVETFGSTVIKNVVVATEIISEYVGDGTNGGIVAIGHDNLLLENVAFVGIIEANVCDGNGGFIGYTHGGNNTVIKNSYISGELYFGEGNNAPFARNTNSFENVWTNWDNTYYEGGDDYLFDNDGELISGELCYKLGNKAWFQTLGTDAYPVPFASHATVYAHGTINCSGEGDLTYDNTEGAPTYENHNFVNGECSACHNAFQISDAEGMTDLAYDVMDGEKFDAYIELTADIDLAGSDFFAIGGRADEGGTPFQGHFNGNGHTVNLALEIEANNQGLIGVVADGAIVENVIVTGSVSAKGYAAGIVGATNGAGKVVIQNCGNEADVTVAEANAAGILGVDDGSAMQVTILNCYNTGNIVGGRESAAICGWLGNQGCTVTNTWSSGSIEGVDGTNTFFRNGNAKAYNCYETFGSQVTQVTEDQVKNGELCNMLNEGAGETIWYQTVGEDEHPVLDSTHANAIQSVAATVAGAEAIYTVNGAKVAALQKGINIVKMNNGTVKKILVK